MTEVINPRSRLAGKVALVTGAGRGQGRAHALRLARAGADVVAVDVCHDLAAFPYPMAKPEDLDETARKVEKEGARCSSHIADVAERSELERAYRAGLAELGVNSVDIVVANAGGIGYPADTNEDAAFRGQLDVMLVGTWNTLKVTTPDMVVASRGGAIVLTSSTAAIKGYVGGWGGLDGYTAAKAGIVGIMRVYANRLAPHSIRVNTIHPTGVNSGMVQNDAFANWALGAMGNDPAALANPMPVMLLEPDDVAAAVEWLVSDDAKWVTGVALPIDAGFTNK
jgi:SDR family mycofactocin-dependent oxidoreductase